MHTATILYLQMKLLLNPPSDIISCFPHVKLYRLQGSLPFSESKQGKIRHNYIRFSSKLQLVFLCAINIKSRVRDEVALLSEYFFSPGLSFPNVWTSWDKLVVQFCKSSGWSTTRNALGVQTVICVQFVCIKNTCLNRHNCSLNKS